MVDADADLVERACRGDEDAFADLVRRYQSRLLRLAESLLPSRAVAEEVVQDTWLGVVRGIDRFQGQSTFKTWLFRILVNRARTAGAREPRLQPLGEDTGPAVQAERFDPSGSWAAPPEAWAEAAEDRVAAGQLAALIRGFLEQLPFSQRQVVMLRDVEGLASEHVCEVLGIKDGHQRVLLHRGRAHVRRLLDAQMGSAG